MARERARRRPRSFSEKFWEDRNGNFVVWQKPNKYLWTWIITLALNWITPFGWLSKVFGAVSLVALIIWAILEAFKGVNYFRRTLGILILILLILVRI